MARKVAVARSLVIGASLALPCLAVAQDVLLRVSTRVGDEKAEISEHTIVAGKEATIYTGTTFRVRVTPTLLSSADIKLDFRVFDVGSNAPVSSPTVVAQVGAQTGLGIGSETSTKALIIEFTPSLK